MILPIKRKQKCLIGFIAAGKILDPLVKTVLHSTTSGQNLHMVPLTDTKDSNQQLGFYFPVLLYIYRF